MQLFKEHLQKINNFLDKNKNGSLSANLGLNAASRNVIFDTCIQNDLCTAIGVGNEAEVYDKKGEALREEGLELIESLIQSAQVEKERSRSECEKYANERIELIKLKENAACEYSKIKNVNNQLAAEIEGISENSQQLEEEREALAKQLETLTTRIDKANEKENYAKKWCWVPGYGLYVAIDCATDSDVKMLENLSAQREMLGQAYGDNLRLLEEKKKTLEYDNLEHSQKTKELFDLQIKLDKVNDEITNASLNVSQWDKIQDQYRNIKTMLSLEEISAEEAMSRLNFMEIDTALFKKELVRAFNIDHANDKEGLLKEGLTTPGGLAYVHSQDRVQFIKDDVIPGVQSIRLEKEHVLIYDYVVRVVCGCPEDVKKLYFEFGDESGDQHTLNIIRKRSTQHTVRYSSEKPNIISIKWVCN